RLLQPLDDGHVAPVKDDRGEELTDLAVDGARQADADAGHVYEFGVFLAQAPYLTTDLFEEGARVCARLEACAGDDAAVEVCEREYRLVGAHVEAEDAVAKRVEAERRGRLAADGCGAPRAVLLDDVAVAQKLARDHRDGRLVKPAHLRQFGARDRLAVRADAEQAAAV